MDVDRLRAETRPEHEATEATLPLMAADLTLEQYAEALQRLHGVLRGWEEWAAQHGPDGYRNLLAERQRSRLIEADLAFLQVPLRTQGSNDLQAMLSARLLTGSAVLSAARFLGAMYVVEGSTLGGQYIAKHVGGKFGFQDGRGNAYFLGYGDRTGSMWRSFKEELIVLPDGDAGEVIFAAKSMFEVFGAAMIESEIDAKSTQH